MMIPPSYRIQFKNTIPYSLVPVVQSDEFDSTEIRNCVSLEYSATPFLLGLVLWLLVGAI